MLRLDLQFFAGEKTEEATPHKKQEARKKGEVAKSPEVASSLTLLLCFLFLLIWGSQIINGIFMIFRQSFSEFMLWELTISSTQVLFNQILWETVKLVAPILLVVVVAGVIANYLQVGFMFNGEGLKMKLSKLNPIEGAKRIFSLRSLVELIKSILKILVTSFIAGFIIWSEKDELFLIGEKNIWDAARFVGALTLKIGIVVSCSLVILAIADYYYQRYEHNKKQRMSKQDIKDEHKKMEGDPFIKGQRRAKQRQLSMNRMMQEVPKADVVITNPTHFAVAIRYDFDTMASPVVIAKGQDHIALKIKEIAKENKIMTVENVPLARALFAAVEIGQPIPEELFNAVGEVLAYVYYQEGRYKGMMT